MYASRLWLLTRQVRLTVQEVPICGHATLAAAKVVLSRYPDLLEIKFATRYWGELTAKRWTGGVEDTNSLEVVISLSTLPKTALDKLVEEGPSNLSNLAEPLASILGIQKEQVIGVGEFKYNDKSLIVEVAPDVDLANGKVDPKALVSLLHMSQS
jgi:predicted PhzF superfamily epimerase YddE/YHI9